MTFRSKKGKAPIASTTEAAKQNTHNEYNTASAQRARILSALKIAPTSTIECRRDLDILHPGARIFELRREGNDIHTFWSQEPTECGRLHRVAKYVLLKKAANQ